MYLDKNLSKISIESMRKGRSRSHQILKREREKKKEMKWKTSLLVAHAARIAKPTLCVVAIGVGVVAGEVISGRFKKGVQFDVKKKEKKSQKC